MRLQFVDPTTLSVKFTTLLQASIPSVLPAAVMRSIFAWGCLVAALFQPGLSDIYLHCPPGSNNRLNGQGAAVTNAARLYDSQNNGNAGYNVGEKSSGKTTSEVDQLPQEFYMSGCHDKAKTEVEVMWTNQHGTGKQADHFVESQVILQYMCQPFPDGEEPLKNINTQFKYHTIRNGQNTNQQGFSTSHPESSLAKIHQGLHEPFHYYQSYYRRERNKGLFTADQKLAGDLAIYTRQNRGGTRRGYEIPEERDYYPYWGPSPWKDIAIMVSDEKTMDLMKKQVSSSDYGYKYMCIMPTKLAGNPNCQKKNDGNLGEKCVAKYLTETECKKNGGKWIRFITNVIEKTAGVISTCHSIGDMKLKRGVPYEPHEISQGADQLEQYVLIQKPPDVLYAPSTYVNHNGVGTEGRFATYKWKVPCFPSNVTQRCVLRIRYNITTDDVPRDFDAKDNSKVKNDPKTKATDGHTDLQLALNTNQLGRTFQDRTHVFLLKPRSLLPKKYQHSTIKYIFGMGKRGNIVQAYPAMEYRFFPEVLEVTTDDVVCFVWSGSNHNPSNFAGEGTAQTDRTNVCWVKEGCSSLKPKTCSSFPFEVIDHVDNFDADSLNLHLNRGCYTGTKVDAQLNNAPASCNPPCFRMKIPGDYCYMSTRNNNFSNRRHIGKIIVTHGSRFPKHEYGDKTHPGFSCKDIQSHMKKRKKDNGIYWIRLKRKVACTDPLGMEKKIITDAQITASAQHSHGRAFSARLNNRYHSGYIGAWYPARNDQHQWLQVDLGRKTDVTGIKTQGRPAHANHFVRTYTISYSDDGTNFTPYLKNKVFRGNNHHNTVHFNAFHPTIVARYIRIHPRSWHGYIFLRIELLGCPSVDKTPFQVYCDMDAGGWTMVFKAVGGVDRNVYHVYKSDHTYSEGVKAALEVTNKHKHHYKNKILLNWKAFAASEARVGLYTAGKLVKELKFNAEGTNRENWFSSSKLTDSPWSDIQTTKRNHFSIQGDAHLRRHFFINHKYGGCSGDLGWIVIGGKACDWEKNRGNSPILYSKKDTFSNWIDKSNVEKADVLAVFVR